MVQTRLFKSNKSQAVRLPKAVALPDGVNEVDIVAVGNRRIISPAGTAWDEWFESGPATSDYMNERSQSADQEREAFDD